MSTLKMVLEEWLQPLTQRRREQVLKQLGQAASPGFDFFLLVFLSGSIATFGLIVDSGAVIIGAMLIAPLMSPILGLSLASVSGEPRIFRRSLVALVEGAFMAILLSLVLGWIGRSLPFGFLIEIPLEIISRTHPTPIDLGIALAGGAAAAYALAQPHLSAALPGVAIATALMPPLCTVGIGISLYRPDITLGAFLLFLTNFVAISFAGIIVFAALGFRPRSPDKQLHRLPSGLIESGFLVLLVTVPLVLLTLGVVQRGEINRQVRDVVVDELKVLPDAELVELNQEMRENVLSLVVTVRASRQMTYQQVVNMQSEIATRLQQPVSLQLIIVPTTRLDPLEPPTFTPTALPGVTNTATPTITPSMTSTVTPSATPTQTSTNTPTVTMTPTPTLTPTSTPVVAYIANTSGLGVFMRREPNGTSLPGALPEGAAVGILYRRTIINDVEWIEVRDLLGRTGWVKAQFLVIRP